MLVRNNGDGMQIKADSALQKLSSVADKLTATTPKAARAEMLKSLMLWYEPPKKEETEPPRNSADAPSSPSKPQPRTPNAGKVSAAH